MKNIFLISIALILAVSTGVFYSCNKTANKKEIAPQKIDPNILASGGLDASNPANPYDSIGYYHNLLLDSVLIHIDSSSTSADLKTLLIQKRGVLPQTIYGKTVSTSDYSDYVDSSISVYNQYNGYTTYTPSFDSSEATDIYDSISSYLDGIDNTVTYASLKQEIVTFENDIASSLISSSDKEKLYHYTSVFRWSAQFWDTHTPPVHNARKWWKYILPDIVGSLGGLHYGPWGALIGAVAGSALYDLLFPE